MIVLDTNIVLDAFVFADASTRPLKQALAAGSLRWLVTPPMREELERVLAYPKIAARLDACQRTAAEVLAQLDALAHLVAVAGQASLTCADPDDQKFIDLAVAHKATLLSKDQAVLCLAKRLLALEVRAARVLAAADKGAVRTLGVTRHNAAPRADGLMPALS